MAAPERYIAGTVRDLERRFGRFVAVNRVSFDVAKGEIFGFLGPNGSGKSTTLRMLTGILAPSGGNGQVAGSDVRTDAEIGSASGRARDVMCEVNWVDTAFIKTHVTTQTNEYL